MPEILINVSSLCKNYPSQSGQIQILKNINFTVSKSETVSVMGSSGSGKTTLLGLLAGLDRVTSGSISIDNQQIEKLNEEELAALRLQKMGFVFQNFQLLGNLTALENVLIPLELKKRANARSIALQFLKEVGLGQRSDHYPGQLSGGEQQRVAIARAFANEPQILLADEPTGNLDGETSEMVQNLLFELNAQRKTTLIIVTHDEALAQKTQRVIRLKNGEISN